MNEQGLFRRRHLPHIDVEDRPFFITGCLHGSLSANGLARIRQYSDELDRRPRPEKFNEAEWELAKQKMLFKLFDDLLDGESPVNHLADERCAGIVENAFLHFAGQRYKLIAYVVMPSHHHWLFLPNSKWSEEFHRQQIHKPRKQTPREAISHSIQSFTATQCNRVLGRTGQFWQQETFDHYVRDEAELFRIITYIENNPVKAGLVAEADQWRWSSATYRTQHNNAPGEAITKVG